MRGGIVAVDATTKDGDRRTASLERAAMRRGIDSTRKSTDDDKACCGQLSPRAARDGRAVAGARASAHDRDRRLREERGLRHAADEETRRRVVNRSQERREVGCGTRQKPVSVPGKALEVRALVEAPLEGTPALAMWRPD